MGWDPKTREVSVCPTGRESDLQFSEPKGERSKTGDRHVTDGIDFYTEGLEKRPNPVREITT